MSGTPPKPTKADLDRKRSELETQLAGHRYGCSTPLLEIARGYEALGEKELSEQARTEAAAFLLHTGKGSFTGHFQPAFEFAGGATNPPRDFFSEARLKYLLEAAQKATLGNFPGEAAAFRTIIRGVRNRIAKARGNIFAHKSYLEEVPKVVWADLENVHAEAVRVLTWYGWYYGHAYSFRVPGYAEDCNRFIEGQKSIKWVP